MNLRSAIPFSTIFFIKKNHLKQKIVDFLQKHFVFASYSNYLGASRGFAFVEFNTVEEAARWMELTQVSTQKNQYKGL